MGKVADALKNWADEHEMKWSRRDAALAWAETQGDDMRAAWNECPRADDLMALAGMLQAPMKTALVTTGRLLRPSLELATKRDALTTRAVYLAETWSAASERASRTADEQLEAHMQRNKAPYQECTLRLMVLGMNILEPTMQSEIADGGERLRALAASDDGAWVDAEATRLLATPSARAALQALGVNLQSAQREVARVMALAAALELSRATRSAHATLKALATLARIDGMDRSTLDASLVEQLAEGAVSTEVDVFGLLSGAIGLAADAHGRDAVARWCCDERDGGFLRAGARTVFESAAHSLLRPDEPAGVLPLHAEIDRVIASVSARQLQAMADTLRSAISYDALAQRPKYE